MSERFDVAIVGSGFAGSLLARVLAVLGREVVLLERGAHPRFAIGESSTPLANLSLERLAARYDLPDCYRLATHGRWLEHFPELRCGLKRGFTFYRHHPGQRPDDATLAAERLLVAASPNAAVADTHWLRADVDHHFVRRAVAVGVDYRDHVELSTAEFDGDGARLRGHREGAALELHADFVIDATGPGGFLANQLAIPSVLDRVRTQSAILFGHFANVRQMREMAPGMREGPYPDDWSAMHHLIDEGWMYSLRFDHGVTSAGFALTPRGLGSLGAIADGDPQRMWSALLDRYPTIAAAFREARPLMPLVFRDRIQHRLASAAGARWALLPHAYAFVDPLFSTGIAWSLRAVERLASCFEPCAGARAFPSAADLARYEALLAAEADQIDAMVAGAYEAMAHFDLFAAQAMIYFAAVSYSEVRQRFAAPADRDPVWSGFLGVGDPLLEPLPLESLDRLRAITGGEAIGGSRSERESFARWVQQAIAPRNIGGFADPARENLYPVDLDVLVERHALLDMTRQQITDALPLLRGISTEPTFGRALR
jgi:tetracycline 7-halogenase / FADH2 O2-dependent halogenase